MNACRSFVAVGSGARVGPTGRVIAVIHSERSRKTLEDLKLAHVVLQGDATKPTEILDKVLGANKGREVDLCINCVNIQGTEMASILPVRDDGTVYFFSMATSFTRAALGAVRAAPTTIITP